MDIEDKLCDTQIGSFFCAMKVPRIIKDLKTKGINRRTICTEFASLLGEFKEKKLEKVQSVDPDIVFALLLKLDLIEFSKIVPSVYAGGILSVAEKVRSDLKKDIHACMGHLEKFSGASISSLLISSLITKLNVYYLSESATNRLILSELFTFVKILIQPEFTSEIRTKISALLSDLLLKSAGTPRGLGRAVEFLLANVIQTNKNEEKVSSVARTFWAGIKLKPTDLFICCFPLTESARLILFQTIKNLLKSESMIIIENLFFVDELMQIIMQNQVSEIHSWACKCMFWVMKASPLMMYEHISKFHQNFSMRLPQILQKTPEAIYVYLRIFTYGIHQRIIKADTIFEETDNFSLLLSVQALLHSFFRKKFNFITATKSSKKNLDLSSKFVSETHLPDPHERFRFLKATMLLLEIVIEISPDQLRKAYFSEKIRAIGILLADEVASFRIFPSWFREKLLNYLKLLSKWLFREGFVSEAFKIILAIKGIVPIDFSMAELNSLSKRSDIAYERLEDNNTIQNLKVRTNNTEIFLKPDGRISFNNFHEERSNIIEKESLKNLPLNMINLEEKSLYFNPFEENEEESEEIKFKKN